MAETIIQLDGVVKTFGAFRALDGVSLHVVAGEKIVVCGPSGSGKSTLIRCINRLEAHDQGRITVEGIELTDRTAGRVRREVGMVFQQFNLFPHLTVLRNLTLGPMRARGLSAAEAEARAMEYLERVRIPEQAAKFPAQLSGGQQQRVAIATRALHGAAHHAVRRANQRARPGDDRRGAGRDGRTGGLGHDDDRRDPRDGVRKRRVADRMVFMDQGEIVEIAPPEQFFSTPADGTLPHVPGPDPGALTCGLPLRAVRAAPARAACGQNFSWSVVDPTLKNGWNNLSFLLLGFQYTVVLSVVSLAISVPIGLMIGICGLTAIPGADGVQPDLCRDRPGDPAPGHHSLGLLRAAGIRHPHLAVLVGRHRDWPSARARFRPRSSGAASSPSRAARSRRRSRSRFGVLGHHALCDPAPGDPAHPAGDGQSVHLCGQDVLAGFSVIGAPELTRKARRVDRDGIPGARESIRSWRWNTWSWCCFCRPACAGWNGALGSDERIDADECLDPDADRTTRPMQT